MLNDTLANALSSLMTGERRRKDSCMVRPASRLAAGVMQILHDERYVGEVKLEDTAQGRRMHVQLLGSINRCGAIKPRFSVTRTTYEQYEKRFLPAQDFGLLIVSTSSGVMTHREAKRRGLGGRLIAYCY